MVEQLFPLSGQNTAWKHTSGELMSVVFALESWAPDACSPSFYGGSSTSRQQQRQQRPGADFNVCHHWGLVNGAPWAASDAHQQSAPLGAIAKQLSWGASQLATNQKLHVVQQQYSQTDLSPNCASSTFIARGEHQYYTAQPYSQTWRQDTLSSAPVQECWAETNGSAKPSNSPAILHPKRQRVHSGANSWQPSTYPQSRFFSTSINGAPSTDLGVTNSRLSAPKPPPCSKQLPWAPCSQQPTGTSYLGHLGKRSRCMTEAWQPEAQAGRCRDHTPCPGSYPDTIQRAASLQLSACSSWSQETSFQAQYPSQPACAAPYTGGASMQLRWSSLPHMSPHAALVCPHHAVSEMAEQPVSYMAEQACNQAAMQPCSQYDYTPPTYHLCPPPAVVLQAPPAPDIIQTYHDEQHPATCTQMPLPWSRLPHAAHFSYQQHQQHQHQQHQHRQKHCHQYTQQLSNIDMLPYQLPPQLQAAAEAIKQAFRPPKLPTPITTTTTEWLAACAGRMGYHNATSIFLTQHCWNRVEKVSHVLVSWQHSEPSLVRKYMMVLLWTCGKLEESRKTVPGGQKVADLLGLSTRDVGKMEAQLMELLEWSPYAGFMDPNDAWGTEHWGGNGL